VRETSFDAYPAESWSRVWTSRYAGVREEEIAVLAAEIRKAQARVVYAEAQHARTAHLAQDQFASQQALDQAVMDLATGHADVAEAKANHASAMAGPTKEERAIADAQVLAAAAELAVLERRLEKNTLRAPADGTVQVVVAEVGEAIRAGQAVLTIETAANRWLSFNIREDRLLGTTVGTRVGIMTGGANGPISATVTELLPLGQFATFHQYSNRSQTSLMRPVLLKVEIKQIQLRPKLTLVLTFAFLTSRSLFYFFIPPAPC
jgi:HlyD family secretion protein